MLGQIDSNKTYLYIIGGNITQKVSKETAGAVMRKNKKEIEIWELKYRFVAGKVTKLEIDKNEFGKYLNITINDKDDNYVFALPCESAYFSNFVSKIDNIDFASEVSLSPYNLKDKTGRTKAGVTVYQNGDSVAYSISLDEKPEGYPVYPDGCETGDAAQKMFFIQKTEWEINYVANKTFNFFEPVADKESETNTNIEFQDFDQNTLGDDEVPF